MESKKILYRFKEGPGSYCIGYVMQEVEISPKCFARIGGGYDPGSWYDKSELDIIEFPKGGECEKASN